MRAVSVAFALVVTALVVYIASIHRCNLSWDAAFNYDPDAVQWNGRSYSMMMNIWSQFGNPLYYDHRRNGYAVWAGDQLKSTYWTRLMVFDRMMDGRYISASVKVKLPTTGVANLVQLDEALVYNQLRQELTVYANSVLCAMGMAVVAIKYADDRINATDARAEIKKYKTAIPENEYDALSYELSRLS